MDDFLGKRPIVLIVDDNLMQRTPMKQTLTKAGFQVDEAENGLQALEHYSQLQPDIVLLDVMMPVLDGFATCEALRKTANGQHLPILMVTGLDDVASIDKAFKVGATDFITKPINWSLLPYRVRYMLRSSTTTLALAQSKSELVETRLEIIRRLSIASEFRDNETGNHIIRMSKYSALIGRSAGLSKRECDLLINAAPMHDVGKIGTPDNILLKPGKLTEGEFKKMKEHAAIGAEMLFGNPSELMSAAHIIALSHHEKWNGSGYLVGLSGLDIPLYGRICAIADVFDALTSKRPYKNAWAVDEAVTEIKRTAGSHFDPALVVCFENVLPGILDIKRKYEDFDSAVTNSNKHLNRSLE